jgi:hypothetical protein
MADPLVVRLANEFRQQLVEREAASVAEMARRWLQVEEALQDSISSLVEQLAQSGETPTEAQLFRLRRFQELLAQTQAEIRQYLKWAAGQIDEEQRDAAGQGMEDALGLLGATAEYYGQNRAVVLSFDQLNIGAAENITALARTGKPLATLLEAAYPLAAEGIAKQMAQGVALGINPREVTRRILRQGLAEGLNHILLVSRDQHLRAYREATRQQYRQSRVVYGYRRLAAKQPGRTCLACLALDGTIYDTEELMALHPQDRCTMLPLLRGFAEIPLTTGEAYFRTLDTAVQRDWMGPERFELWQQGRFPFRRMVKIVENETWGPGAQVRPVREFGLGSR